jgi:hypothetical protein
VFTPQHPTASFAANSAVAAKKSSMIRGEKGYFAAQKLFAALVAAINVQPHQSCVEFKPQKVYKRLDIKPYEKRP